MQLCPLPLAPLTLLTLFSWSREMSVIYTVAINGVPKQHKLVRNGKLFIVN